MGIYFGWWLLIPGLRYFAGSTRQKLKSSILHGLMVMIMVSMVSAAETAYFKNSINRSFSVGEGFFFDNIKSSGRKKRNFAGAARQKLKIYILHGLMIMMMVLVVLAPETANFKNSINRSLSVGEGFWHYY